MPNKIEARMNAIIKAVADISTIPFAPTGEIERYSLMDLLGRLCDDDPAHIAWLGEKMAGSYAKWPGQVSIRAVWCTRFPPADGVEGSLGADDPVGREIAARTEIKHPDPDQKRLSGAARELLDGIKDACAITMPKRER